MSNPQNAAARAEVLRRPVALPVRMAVGVLVFAIATAISAKVQVMLPGTPVPFTFQTLVVLLAGALLGARLGAASQVLYLAAGVAGIPAFAFGGGVAYLLGPTGGYLLAAPLAAAAVGMLAGAGVGRLVLAMLAGLAVMYAGGVAWLAMIVGGGAVVGMGLTPFILAELVKVGIGALAARQLRSGSLTLFGGR